MNKPYSDACDRNRDPILSAIRPLFADCQAVLEIGAGTGQHAVYFAEKLPHLVWYASDCGENLCAIKQWFDESDLDNVKGPVELDVAQTDWPGINIDAVFSANTVHIMNWPEVKALFAGVGRLLPASGLFILYGPFNYDNNYTSESNKQFDIWLKMRDPQSGIRNFEDLDDLAVAADMIFKQDYEMPANNRLLCWQKIK